MTGRSINCYIPSVVFALLLLAASCGGNRDVRRLNAQGSSSDSARIDFREYEHDFGRITEGEKVAYIFKFENTGNGPLAINAVTTSCGCTAPRYSTRPVQPGGSGTIEVVFDSSGRSGLQTKSITVKTNASKPYVLLQIRAEIISDINN